MYIYIYIYIYTGTTIHYTMIPSDARYIMFRSSAPSVTDKGNRAKI